jgi:hypothetical protein
MNKLHLALGVLMSIISLAPRSLAQEAIRVEDLVQHLKIRSWIYDGKQLPKQCLVSVVEVRNGQLTDTYLGSVALRDIKRMVILLDNNNPDQKVNVTIKVDGGPVSGISNDWAKAKKIDLSAYLTMPLTVGKPIMLCGKIRPVNGVSTTNGDMKDFEEGLALVVTEEKKDQ